MGLRFNVRSSDAALLGRASRVARDFAGRYAAPPTVGILFLGAVARGYFDASADIDVAIFTALGQELAIDQYQRVEGIEIHTHLAEFEAERAAGWSMPKRWTFSQALTFYDPGGSVAALLQEKLPLKPDERRWLLMSGLALSEWYVNRLSRLWVERGSPVSAHHMFERGLDYFLDMLFALNHELIADTKWKYFCAGQLDRLPAGFQEGMQSTMLLAAFTVEELERRRNTFMRMWQEMLPVVEGELGMTYAEILDIV